MATSKLYQHPDFPDLKEHWERLRVLYEADKLYIKQPDYLWPHELESITGNEDSRKLRGLRERRSVYTNWFEPILSRYTSLFFKEEPNTEQVDDLFGDYVDDVDGKGNSLLEFIKKQVVKNYLLYGRPIILTDSFNMPAKSMGEEQQLGKRPYFELLDPLAVPDWQIEEFDPMLRGKFRFVHWEYDLIQERTSGADEPQILKRRKEFLLIDGRYVVTTYQQNKKAQQKQLNQRKDNSSDWDLVDRQDLGPFEELPIVSLEGEKSWFRDLEGKCLQYYNQESSLDNILYYQGHERLWLAGDIKKEHREAAAEYTIGLVPEGTALLQATPVDPTAHEKRLDKILLQIQKIAFNQGRTTPDDSRQVEGADSQRETKDDFVNLIVTSISEIENLMNRAVKHWAMFMGKSNFEGKIEFSKDVSIEDVDQQINLFNALSTEINNYPLWKRELLQKFAKVTDASDEAIKEIQDKPLRQIETPGIGRTTDIRTQLQERLLGNQANGEAQQAEDQRPGT